MDTAERLLREAREAVIDLSSGPLDLAARYGPDYRPLSNQQLGNLLSRIDAHLSSSESKESAAGQMPKGSVGDGHAASEENRPQSAPPAPTVPEERSSARSDDACLNDLWAICRAEGLTDWKIEFTPEAGTAEGLTLFDSKIIILHWPAGEPSFALGLHEIAHAKRGHGGHDSMLVHEFHALVSKYCMPRSLLAQREERIRKLEKKFRRATGYTPAEYESMVKEVRSEL